MARRSRRWLSFAVFLSVAALLGYATLALGAGGGKSSQREITSSSNAASFQDEITQASIQYAAARVAPGTDVAPGAYAAAYAAISNLPVTGGQWSEVTSKPYDSDAHGFRDPTFSNSGGGSGLVTGRMTALAVQQDGTVWAGGADGGVWRSTNGGSSWTPTFDSQRSLSVGAIATDPQNANAVWVGTGENNTAFENYRGSGVYVTTNGGSSWTLVGDGSGGETLDGTTIGKLAFAHGTVFAGTSKGLWKHSASDLSGGWTRVFDASTFNDAMVPYGLSIVNDVVVRPNTNDQEILVNMSWRNGAAYDGFYLSTNGGTTFNRVTLTGSINDNDIGSTNFAYSADGSTLYAVVESPFQINHFTQSGGTTLQGVFVSPTGSAVGPWNKIAEGRKLATSGSALTNNFIGYNPGVQAWYNRFIAVDPTDKSHVYLGLEEVFETVNGGNTWFAIGPYWNFGLPCSAKGLDSCPPTTHPDQHAVAIANGTVFVGNDGGVWSRSTTDTQRVPGWSDLNATLRTLQYYYAGAGKVTGGDAIWGGLQDNGESLISPAVLGGQTMVSPFGGDGGDTLVDPNNGDRAVVEYTDLDMALTTNGGRSDGTANAFREISPSCFAFTYTPSPCDPNPRFIAPFRADAQNINHWVAGGQYVWDNNGKGWDTSCGSSSCDWKIVYNTGSGHSTTAIAVTGSTTYAAWCGPSGCNPRQSSTTGSGFVRGIATNYGGTWHELDMSALPNRYVYSLAVDPANPATVYAVFGGFSRRWIPAGGVGHVFKSTDGGATWGNISGSLPDAPGDDLVIKGGNLYYASDVGVFTATVANPTSWSLFGTSLPHAAVNDLSLAPDGSYLIAATHGRGIWKISLP